MDHDAKLQMIKAMRIYGGGFVRALAECFLLADSRNLARLTQAFPDYVTKYQELAGGLPPEEYNDD